MLPPHTLGQDQPRQRLGVLSLPAALLYLACVLAFPDGETVTLCAVALWLGIPALRSYRVFRGP